MIYLQDIGKEFNITADAVHQILLSYSNSTGQQLMGHNDIGFFVIDKYFDSLKNIKKSFTDSIIPIIIINEHASELIPFDLVPRIYFLLDNNVLVYCGETSVISSRIAAHAENKTFNKVATFPFNKSELLIAKAINALHYKPYYNTDILSPENYFREILKRAYRAYGQHFESRFSGEIRGII